MQIDECYAAFGGNYEDVKSRLMKDDLIKRLVIKFLADTSYERLAAAMEQKNYEEAFLDADVRKILKYGIACNRKQCRVILAEE